MQFRGLVLEYGEIPPAPGPFRDAYLWAHGTTALNAASRLYSDATRDLAIRGHLWREDPSICSPGSPWSALTACRGTNVGALSDFSESIRTLDPPEYARLATLVQESERAAVSALNHLERTSLADACHAWIHRTGALRRALVGCRLTYEDGEYWTNCATRLAHWRVGLSAGIQTSRLCSACGKNAAMCDHISGTDAPHTINRRDETCNVCSPVPCDHREGQVVLAQTRTVFGTPRLDHAAIVRYPRFPDARVTAMTVDVSNRSGREGGRFECAACLGRCAGFSTVL